MAIEKAEIGQIVHWFPDGDRDAPPHPAIVTEVGFNAVSLNIIGPDLRTFRVESGVHHIDDPHCRREETREAGGWRHTDMTRNLERLFREFNIKK